MPATAERQDLDSLRAQVQRKLAAQLDVGEPPPAAAPAAPMPAPAAAESDRPVVRKAEPRSSRQRMDNLRAEAQRNSITRLEKRSLTRFLPAGRGRRRFNPARVLLVAVALVAGGLAAFLALQHEPTAATAVPAPLAKAQAKPIMGKILVAKAAIEVGQPLTPALVEWADWPAAQLRPDYISLDNAPTAPTDLSGAMARYQLFPGEPIEKLQLAPAGSSYLSAILGKGMRAVSVSVQAESASGGFIAPNDHVDVVLTRSSTASHDAQTILSNVRVLAINARLGSQGAPAGSGDAKADVFSGQAIATLELDPVQGDVITEAALVGKLSLVLRPTGETVGPATAQERAVNAAIRLTSPFWTAGGAPAAPAVSQTLH
jgi:pilus assembly protein CpaB